MDAGPTTGSLKTKISLKSGQGQIVTPFHTFQLELPPKSEINGSIDLLEAYDLGKLCHGLFNPRRLREEMSSFLPHLYGNLSFNVLQEASSLRALVDKPPIHKEITTLPSSSMQGFKLSTGPVDERYRHLFDKKREVDINWVMDEHPVMGRIRSSLEQRVAGRDILDHEERKRKHKKEKKKKKKNKMRNEDADESSSTMPTASAAPSSTPMEF
ncbi:unnamed protein product [Caenorhabditis bovis]|uniref:Mediator of RNA polymerase II transcription subunit 19 n=1 Tax=Caenorhabditis bovis TaxID=2654633 RepID=A0A8S1ELL1_9PELO|nr:unnamed protein product [Caenorhabditis bovis]